MIASRSAGGAASIAYSRSLLNAAAEGKVAELSTDRQNFDVSQSIVNFGVRSALCVPVMLGQRVALFLYLDSRGDPNSSRRLPLRTNASGFLPGTGEHGGAGGWRISSESRWSGRTASMEHELAAASVAQQWILPKRIGKLGPFAYTGESRPGEYVGGDFYDIIPLDNKPRGGRHRGCLGARNCRLGADDGLCRGFSHAAACRETGDPALSVNRLNKFVGPAHSRLKKFVDAMGRRDRSRKSFAAICRRRARLHVLLAGQRPAGKWAQLTSAAKCRSVSKTTLTMCR